MERGESSSSNSESDDLWAKLVPQDSRCPDIELRRNEITIFSEVKCSPNEEKQEWCKITRDEDHFTATMQNKMASPIFVDGTTVQEDDTATVRCGSEIVLGPEPEGFIRYRFEAMPPMENPWKQLKIVLDPELAKCSICLNVWHDVVTVSPCLHNFCNGCFSDWLNMCETKHTSVSCPQCRAVVHFVGRNHFLRVIEEDILNSDCSLRRPSEDISLMDSRSSIKSPIVSTSYANDAGPFQPVDLARIERMEREQDQLKRKVERLERHLEVTRRMQEQTRRMRELLVPWMMSFSRGEKPPPLDLDLVNRIMAAPPYVDEEPPTRLEDR